MITANERSAEFAHLRRDLIGAGAIAHNVAEIYDGVESWRGGEARFQSF
jgi:hypothetical protein